MTVKTEAGEFYDSISNEDYHKGPGISSSELKIIPSKSAMHFHKRQPVKQTPAMVLGEVLHTFVLEPHLVEKRYAFSMDWKGCKKPKSNKLPSNYNEAENAYTEQCNMAAAAGKTVLKEDPAQMQAIADAVHAHGMWKHITGEEPAFERSYYWDDEETGILLKCRPDVINTSFGRNGSALIVDLKSTVDARDRAFTRQVVDLGYDFSAAMYCAGVEAVTGQKCGWAWFTFEKATPYATRVIIAGPQWLARGRRLFREALTTLAACRESGRWPGLDEGKAVELPFPRWAEQETFAQEAI